MENVKPDRVVVDTETGEILSELTKEDRIVKKKSYQYLKSNVKVQFDNFLLINQENLIKMNEFLTPNEFRYFFILLAYAQFGGRPLGSIQKAISYKEIAEDLGMHEVTLYRNIKNLQRKGLVIRQGDAIYINPYVAVKGMRVDKNTLDMFNNEIWRDDYNL